MLKINNKFVYVFALVFSMLLTGCAKETYDYEAFKASRPASILVLPPVNESVDVKAIPGVYSSLIIPLSESGYYVFPPTLVMETFKENGLTEPSSIHNIKLTKLKKIFNPDAVLYVNIKDYGRRYLIISSANIVTLEAYLVDANTGEEIWRGTATASSEENNNNSSNPIATLVGVALQQVIGSVIEDDGLPTATIANSRLLSADNPLGLLYGPRHKKFKNDSNKNDEKK